MAIKKLSILACLFFLLTTAGNSQQVQNLYRYWSDSSVISNARMPQHTQFLNGTYDFPAKPRSQWELGVKLGVPVVSGDVPGIISPFRGVYGFGVHVRKSLGYILSVRAEYNYGVAKGLDWKADENFAKNPAWYNNNYYAPRAIANSSGQVFYKSVSAADPYGATNHGRDVVFYNYKTTIQDLSVQLVGTLNNIRFHKDQTKIVIYGLAGLGGSVFKTMVDARNGSGNYETAFNNLATSIQQRVYTNRKQIKSALRNILDGNYETPAESEASQTRAKFMGGTLMGMGNVGLGIAYKINDKFNLALEDKHTFIKSDLVDGQRWQEHAWGDAVLTRDFDSYNFLSLGANFNLGSKAVQPLWWINPLTYMYDQIPRINTELKKRLILPDADGDGVTDQFDLEPNTPKGCPVDSHGVSLDTDGDGVPDCKDKEKITPTACQPVDADGVGHCKCPDECMAKIDEATKKSMNSTHDCSSTLGSLPPISVKGSKLSHDAMAALDAVADKLKANPDCHVVVLGYCNSNKMEQQRSWEHVNAVINYLVDKKGIAADRLIFKYGESGGDCDTVDIRSATDSDNGPSHVDAPHPGMHN